MNFTPLAFKRKWQNSLPILTLPRFYAKISRMSKRTFQPKKARVGKVHGFLTRMKSNGGQNVLKARRLKGRKRLTPKASA